MAHPDEMLPDCAKAFGTIETQQVGILRTMRRVDRKFDQLFAVLDGDGSEARPGLLVRMALVEQTAKVAGARRAFVLAIIASVMSILGVGIAGIALMSG